MNPKQRVMFDPVIVIGSALSVLLALIFYIREDNRTAIAIFAGLLGTIITLQIETLLRERRRAEYESRMGALVARLETMPWLGELVERITTSSATVEDAYADTPAPVKGRQIIEETARQLADLEAGHFRTPWDDNEISMKLVRELKNEMLVTSVPSVDLEWWHTPEGKRYWELQRSALQDGAMIRRVFIYDEWTDRIDRMAREQQAAGVVVRRVHQDQLPTYLVGVMGIYDYRCGLELEYSTSGEPLSFSFVVAPADIDRLRRQFDRIERMAVNIEDESGAVGVTE